LLLYSTYRSYSLIAIVRHCVTVVRSDGTHAMQSLMCLVTKQCIPWWSLV